jgi:uncharacterized protein YbjT (DUF2867 family)
VIGATGFVGSAIIADLRSAGHDVTGIARTDTAAEQLTAAGITPVTADLDDRMYTTVAAALDAEAVVLAAQLPPDVEEWLRALAGR